MRHPRHLGPLPAANSNAAVGNPACGDVLTLHLRIDGETIHEARFESLGSAFQLATASVLCDALGGLPVADAEALAPEAILVALPELPQQHNYLARLAIDALRRALADWRHGGRVGARHVAVDESGGRSFVRRILGNGRRWTTREVEAMAEAEAIALPYVAVKFLATLRREGLIKGEMDVARHSWTWWL